MEVDRVAVPRDVAVAAADVTGDLPDRHRRRRGRRDVRVLALAVAGAVSLLALGRLGSRADAQVGARALPGQLAGDAHLGAQVNLRAAVVWAQVLCPDLQIEVLLGEDRAVLVD